MFAHPFIWSWLESQHFSMDKTKRSQVKTCTKHGPLPCRIDRLQFQSMLNMGQVNVIIAVHGWSGFHTLQGSSARHARRWWLMGVQLGWAITAGSCCIKKEIINQTIFQLNFDFQIKKNLEQQWHTMHTANAQTLRFVSVVCGAFTSSLQARVTFCQWLIKENRVLWLKPGVGPQNRVFY